MKFVAVVFVTVSILWSATDDRSASDKRSASDRNITQEPTPAPSSFTTTSNKPASTIPIPRPSKPAPASAKLALSADTNWVAIDTFSFEQLITHGLQYAIGFDNGSRTLKDTLIPNFNFPDSVEQAIAKAPTWLKWDLRDQFSRLSTYIQGPFASVILHCPDNRCLDEICFQIAHLAPRTLNLVDPQLLVANAQWIYTIAADLKYVKLVEYGNPAAGGNYYTTARYRIKRGSDTVEVEIPKEIYYWWIVEPRCSDELPSMNASVYNKFWREYLYTYADSTYPLLKDVLAPVKILWDEQEHVWNNSGQDFGDSLQAIQAVGRWVAHTLPAAAAPPRPIQPNQLLRDHNGNCGECQDLLCAGMRTALIPNISLLDINEDHVWNEVPWNDSYYENQVDLGGGVTHIGDFSTSYDKDVGGSKECSCIWDWRADGYQFSSIERYSKTCTLTVSVVDKDGRPIDGVNVNIDARDFYDAATWDKGFAGATDRAGMFTTVLGNAQDYRLTLQSTFGSKSLGVVIDSARCAAGSHFYVYDTLTTAEMPSLDIAPKTYPPQPAESYKIVIDYHLPYETIYGTEYTYTSYSPSNYAWQKPSGAIDFFIVDPANLGRYSIDSSFQAYEIKENDDSGRVSFIFPTKESYYCVFTNTRAKVVSEFIQGTAVLYKNTLAAVAEKPTPLEPLVMLGSYPNPSRGIVYFRYRINKPGTVSFKLYDLRGGLVATVTADDKKTGEHSAALGSPLPPGKALPAGVYFYTVQLNGGQPIGTPGKFIIIK